jgi:hypothetical protein
MARARTSHRCAESFRGFLVSSGTSGNREVLASEVRATGVFSGVGRIVERANLPRAAAWSRGNHWLGALPERVKLREIGCCAVHRLKELIKVHNPRLPPFAHSTHITVSAM